MFEKIDFEEVLSTLQKGSEFALEKLEFEYFPPNDLNIESVILKPDSINFSLLGSYTYTTTISNGGITDYDEDFSNSIRCNIFMDRNIKASFPLSLTGLSMLTPDVMLGNLKKFFLITFPVFMNNYISMEKKNNGTYCLAPKKDVTYIEEKPVLPEIPSSMIDELSLFSKEIYSYENVFNCNIALFNNIGFDIFVDQGSKIIQYVPNIQVHITINYLDDNNVVVEWAELGRFTDVPSASDIDKLKKKCLDRLEVSSKNYSLYSGVYPVLLKPSASNVFFHEALAAHMLSATYIGNDVSTVFKNRLGEKIPTLEGIDIIMDPELEDGFGSYKYDHEGVKSKKIYLIKDGVIQKYLSDRGSEALLEQKQKDKLLLDKLVEIVDADESLLTKYVNEKYLGRKFSDTRERLKYLLENWWLDDLINNVDIDIHLHWREDTSRLINESNGHSRVQFWLDETDDTTVSTEARMSNLIVSYRDETVSKINLKQEMLDYCQNKGLDFYLEVEAYSGEIDVRTGVFTIYPSEIFKVYSDGKRENIKVGTFSVNLEDFLKNIVSIGTENEENKGVCGASSGFVPVGSLTPEIIVSDIAYQEASETEIASDELISFLQHK